MVYGYIIRTSMGYVHYELNTNEIWLGGTNCVVAVFRDRKRAQRIAKRIKKRWKVRWTKTILAINVSKDRLKFPH